MFNGVKKPPNFRTNMMNAIDELPLTDDLAKKLLKDAEATSEDLKDILKSRNKDIFIITE